jgi:hypothetical protein
MFFSAKQLLAAGKEGKWVKVTQEEIDNIVESIAGENMIRGAKGEASLRHYIRNGYIAIHTKFVQIDAHPDDSK